MATDRLRHALEAVALKAASTCELAPISLDIHLSKNARGWMLPRCRDERLPSGVMGTTLSGQRWNTGRAMPLDDAHGGVLAEPEVARDQAVAEALLHERDDAGGVSVGLRRRTLPRAFAAASPERTRSRSRSRSNSASPAITVAIMRPTEVERSTVMPLSAASDTRCASGSHSVCSRSMVLRRGGGRGPAVRVAPTRRRGARADGDRAARLVCDAAGGSAPIPARTASPSRCGRSAALSARCSPSTGLRTWRCAVRPRSNCTRARRAMRSPAPSAFAASGACATGVRP